MKVVRAQIDVAHIQDAHCGGSHVDYAVLVLQNSVHLKKPPSCHCDPIPFVQLRIDDGIGDACLICQAEKDERSAVPGP